MRWRVYPGSLSLLCLSTPCYASLGPSGGISERRRKEVPVPQISEARVLIVATDGFEEWELFGPREILQRRGAEVVLASPKRDPIHATIHDDPGNTIRPDF